MDKLASIRELHEITTVALKEARKKNVVLEQRYVRLESAFNNMLQLQES